MGKAGNNRAAVFDILKEMGIQVAPEILEQTAEEDKERREKEAEYNKAYREANREQIAAQAKAYREANREQIAAQAKAYREANREKIHEHKKAYYEANREKILERKKAYREANRENLAAKAKAYYEANREKLSAINKAYREANRENLAAKAKAYYEANREKIAEYKKANRERIKINEAIWRAKAAIKKYETRMQTCCNIIGRLVAQESIRRARGITDEQRLYQIGYEAAQTAFNDPVCKVAEKEAGKAEKRLNEARARLAQLKEVAQ